MPKKKDSGPSMGDPDPSAAARALGRLGGLKGGPARAKSLTPAERSDSARKAVLARWAKRKKQ